MAIDRAISPWESMEIEANEITAAQRPRRARAGIGIAIRTLVLVVLAAVAILVLLPAALAAQAALVA